MKPSHKRYLNYYSGMLEGSKRFSTRSMLLRTVVLHNVPAGDDGLNFQLKIYQGCHLIHTTDTWFVPDDCNIFLLKLEKEITLQGDIMIQCVRNFTPITNCVLFGLQFHTGDVKENHNLVYGKYQLDMVPEDLGNLPIPNYFEMIFTPGESEVDENHNLIEPASPTKMTDENDRNFRFENISYDTYDRSSKIRDQYQSLQQGIDALDGLLDDLGYKSADSDSSENKSKSSLTNVAVPTMENQPPQPDYLVVKKSQMNLPLRRFDSNSSYESETRSHSSSTTTILNEILSDLDKSPLNAARTPQRVIERTKNGSFYDNGIPVYSPSASFTRSPRTRIDSVEEEVQEIETGTVAKHVNALNSVLFTEPNEYKHRHGIPLAGLNSPEVVEERVSAFNSYSAAPQQAPEEEYLASGSQQRPRLSSNSVNPHDGREGNHVSSDTPQDTSHAHATPTSSNHNGSYKNRPIKVVSVATRPKYTSSKGESPHHSEENKTEEHSPQYYSSPKLNGYTDPINYSQSPKTDQNANYLISSPLPSVSSYPSQEHSANYQTKRLNDGLDFVDAKPLNPIRSAYSSTPVVYQQRNIDRLKYEDTNSSIDSLDDLSKELEKLSNDMDVTGPANHVFTPKGKESPLYASVQKKTQQNVQSSPESDKPPKEFTTPQTSHKHKISISSVCSVDSVPESLISNKYLVESPTTERHRKESSIAEVIEDPVKPTLIQQELECLNEEIIKNLLDEQDDILLKSSSSSTNSTASLGVPSASTASSQRSLNDTPTYGSSDGEAFTGTFYNGSMIYSPAQTIEGSVSPPSNRRFPPMMEALKLTDRFDAPHTPLTNGHTLPRSHRRTRTTSSGSSISDDGALSSPTSPFGRGTFGRRFRSTGSSTSSISSTSDLFQEVLRYPAVKFDKDTVDLWYRPNITRDEATSLLRDAEPGSFLVRDSQTYDGAFGLAVKVDSPPASVLKQVDGDVSKIDLENELIRHFLIEPSKKGVRLKGSNEEPTFPSLVALIYQHSITKMALPITLLIPYKDSVDGGNPADNRLSKLSETQLLVKGAACDLLYLGGVKVDKLTGDGAVQYAMNKVASLSTQLKTTIVNIKVNQDGITLTDNNRRMFFRQHFQMANVLHCGVDPKSRQVNLKTFANREDKDVGCFGFVVENERKTEHQCYMFAELEQDQPASAVINFIHKAMRYARV
eukprot:TCONS_00020236-protein